MEDLVAVSNNQALVVTSVTSAIGVGYDDLGYDIEEFVEGLIVDDDDITALSLEQLG